MNVQLPNHRKLWEKERKANRDLRAQLADLGAELAQMRIDLAGATGRRDALESVNDELRADLASWLGERAMLQDGRGDGPTTDQLRR